MMLVCNGEFIASETEKNNISKDLEMKRIEDLII